MLYENFLNNLSRCPFCQSKQERILQKKYAFLTFSLSPFLKHQLLVVPNRHTKFFNEITDAEMVDVVDLLREAVNVLTKLKHNDISILVREADHKDKSIEHIHFNILPGLRIGDKNMNMKERKILNKQEIEKTLQDITKALNIDRNSLPR